VALCVKGSLKLVFHIDGDAPERIDAGGVRRKPAVTPSSATANHVPIAWLSS